MIEQLFSSRRGFHGPRRPARRPRPAASRLARAAGVEPLEGRALLAAFSFDGSAYTQTFDGLGTVTASPAAGSLALVSPSLAGWFFSEGGSNANTTITAGTGSLSSGDSYNFGLSGGADRSLGGLQSSSAIPSWGFQFTNATGSAITTLDIAYTGETWRIGGTNRSDRIDFQYSTDATSLTTGTWTDVDALDYANPGAASTSNGSVRHSAAISGQLIGLSLAQGSSLFLRWVDFNASGSDDGMAIDDFTLAVPGVVVPGIAAPGSVAPLATITGTASASASFAVSGSNLQADILATAPANFEVSVDGTSFGPTATIPRTGAAASGTVFVRIAAAAAAGGLTGDITLSSTGAASATVAVTGSVRPTLVGLPYGPENFQTTKEPWFTFSTAGGQDWTYRSTTRGVASGTNQVWEVSGFDSSPGALPAHDWLMIGPFDFTAVSQPTIEFSTLNAFTSGGVNVNELSLQVSTAYGGSGDPSLAAWTEIPFPKPLAEDTLRPTGQVPLAGMAGQAGVYVAFRYVATGTGSGQSAIWQVDDVKITNALTPALSLALPTTTREGTTTDTGVVRIPAPRQDDLVVTVSSADAAALLLHGGDQQLAGSVQVTILAGQVEQVFSLGSIRDFDADPDVAVAITATAAGYDPASGSVTVRNIDRPAALLTGGGYTETFSGFSSAAPTLPQGWSAAGLVTSFYALTDEGDQVSWGGGFRSGYRGGASVFGYQHTSSTTSGASPTFDQILTLENDTGSTITDLTISYLGRVARADQVKSPGYTVTVNGVVAAGLAYSTLDGDNAARTATVSGLSIPVGQTVEIVWSSDRGLPESGSSKQIGISQVSVARGAAVAPPTVSNVGVAAATIGRTSAVASADVTSDGGATLTGRGFVLLATAGLAGELTLATPNATVITDAAASTGPMTATFTGLVAGTQYTVRGFATSAEGTAYTSAATFTTETPPASLAGGYSQSFATYAGTLPVGWKVASEGAAVAYVGEWGTGTDAGFRGVGGTTGGVLGYQHTGSSGALTVSLALVNDTGAAIDTLNLSYLGRVARATETRHPAWTVSVNGVAVPALAYSTGNTAGAGDTAADQTMTASVENLGLAPGAEVTITWVSQRDTGQSSGSSRQIGIGDVQITAGVASLPDATVTTTSTVTGITSFTATLAGSATAAGEILERGFVLAPTAVNPAPQLGGMGVSQVIAAAGSGSFTAAAARLSSLTGYSFRAYATTAAGTAYGDVATFATAEGPIAFWDFEGTNGTAGGVGTASLVGGTTEHSTAGAWRVTTFPAQGVDSGTAGVQFLVPTVGYQDVMLSFNHYASNTSSRWARIDFTLDGGQTWTTGFWNNSGGIAPGEFYYPFTVDFSAVAGVANNPDFGVRIVSIFSPVPFSDGLGNSFAADAAYHRPRIDSAGNPYAGSGNWRFRGVTLTGTAITAQTPLADASAPLLVKGTSATLGGTVVSGGGRAVTVRGVLVAPANFGGVLELGAPGVSRFDAAVGGLGGFTAAATGLDLSTGYVYRAFATNADGLTAYSGILEFTTLASDLVATTTTLNAFPARATFGTPVTFTGTVSAAGSGQTPVGTVEIRAGGPSGTLLATTTVEGDGSYSAASAAIAIGSYSGVAAYFLVGDTFDGSSSTPAAGTLSIDPRAFTPGNLLVLRVGNGVTTLGAAADAVTLVEFTPEGALVQEIPVAAVGDAALTLGSNPNNGILSLAADRQSVTFGGYRAAAGSSNPVVSNVPRVIGSVGVDGVIDTSRGFAGVFTSEDFRSVATDDGSNFWLSGAGSGNSGGIRHVADGGTSLTGLLASPPADPNMRQVLVLDGNLFTASGSNGTGRSIYQVGSGLPTTAGQSLVNLLPIGGSSQWQAFYFADLDPAVSWGDTGFDTLYATDLSAVTKLSYATGDSGFTWVDRGSVLLAGASGLTGFTGGDGTVTLYVSSTTLADGGISTIVDASGAGGALAATAANINAASPVTAGANYAFRGLAFVPRAGVATSTTITAISSTVTQNSLQEVTFTASVAATTGSAPPTGVVQFRSGGVLLATATLTGSSATATATVATTSIPFGTYSGITARYIPDGNASANPFNPSVSAAFGTDLVVEPQGEVTTTALTSISPLAAAYGDLVTFSGTVSGDGGGSPSGTVQIRAGGAAGPLLASGSVTNGTFSVSSTTIPGGSYGGIVAVFSGVAGFQNSVSAAFQGTLQVSFTTLGVGDIAFTGFQPAAPESLSFVLLRDVIAGTSLTITDKPWDGSALGSSEGTSTITFTQAFAAGTVFEYLEFDVVAGDIDGQRWAYGGNAGSFSTTGLFDVTSAGFGLSTDGDNLFAYQGAAPTSGTAANWIAGFSTRPFLTSGTVNGQTSYLPAALAAGNAGISLGLAANDASGQGRRLANLGSVSGTPAQIRTVLADPASWVVTTAAANFTSTTTFVVDTTSQPATAPRVTGLYVRGSAWTDDYLDLDVFTTVAGNRLGWQLPDGSAQLANGSAVSWVNVDVISVRFSEAVQLPAVDSMRIVRGSPNGNATTTPVSRQLLAGGTVVQWVFADAITNGRYFVSIPSAGVVNTAGTAALDGEWQTSQSTFATGSGDGTAGGIFNFGFMVLRGNVSGQGSVQTSEVLATRSQIGQAVSAANYRFAIAGQRSVVGSDFLAVRSQSGSRVSDFTDPNPPTEPANAPSLAGFASLAAAGSSADGAAAKAAALPTGSVRLMADPPSVSADTPVPVADQPLSPPMATLISRIPVARADSPATPDGTPEAAAVSREAWAWFAIESEQLAKKK